MMHVKYDLVYNSIHFYRWDSLCYLTEVKKKKGNNQSTTCVLYIYLKKLRNMNSFFFIKILVLVNQQTNRLVRHL